MDSLYCLVCPGSESPEQPGGAELAPAPVGIVLLAGLAVFAQMLDLISGARMMAVYGLSYELNPLIRTVFEHSGPAGMIVVKLGVVLALTLVWVKMARYGRVFLAGNLLLLTAAVGVFGFFTNLV